MIWQKSKVGISYVLESESTSFGVLKKKCGVSSSLHNHCTFCDGTATPEAMAKAAYEKGITDFGFSSHTKAQYPPYVGVGSENLHAYIAEIFALKQEYNGKMRIYTGAEQDYYSPIDYRDKLDYLIGAVHDIYDKNSGKYYWVDGDIKTLTSCIDEAFDGDAMALCRHFYELTVENAIKHKPDILAHFDLIVKNNEGNVFFDENSEQYKKYALSALHECMKTDAVFEINTGGIYRGYRKDPYPSKFLLKELCKNDARVTISSDAHSTKAIAFWANRAKALMRDVGFKYVYEYENGEFTGKLL